MTSSDREALTRALSIYNHLIAEGDIDLEKEKLFQQELEDKEIRDFLEVIAHESQSYLFEYRKKLCLIPEIENRLLSYTNEDLKRSILHYRDNIPDLYVCYYIAISLFAAMQLASGNFREYINVEDLGKMVSESLSRFTDYENLNELEVENEFNIRYVANKWDRLKELKDNKELTNQKSKIGLIISTCKFLSRHDLVELVNENRQIRITEKLKRIILNYYSHRDREYKIMKLLGGGQFGQNQ